MKVAGKNRRYRLIQEYLDERRMNFRDVARELDVATTTVSETARGKHNNRLVLRYFRELGIDPNVLDLPVRVGG